MATKKTIKKAIRKIVKKDKASEPQTAIEKALARRNK